MGEVAGQAEQQVDVLSAYLPWPDLACHWGQLAASQTAQRERLCVAHGQADCADAGLEQLCDLRETGREVNWISISCLHH